MKGNVNKIKNGKKAYKDKRDGRHVPQEVGLRGVSRQLVDALSRVRATEGRSRKPNRLKKRGCNW